MSRSHSVGQASRLSPFSKVFFGQFLRDLILIPSRETRFLFFTNETGKMPVLRGRWS